MTSRPFSRQPLVQLTLVRIREFMREPEAVFWAAMFPIMLSTGLGLAFSARPEPVVAIAAAPALVGQLRTEPGLDVRALAPDAARTALRNGEVALVVEPAEGGGVAFLYDDTNPEGRSARAAADRAIQRAAGRVDPVKTTAQTVREPGSRYIDFLIPGLIGVGIMSNGVWGLGFSIVDTRRRKLTKRLMATPMSKLDYLLSYLIWRVILLPVEVVVPIVFGALAFGVPMRGSWWAVGVLTLLGSMMFSSIGILVGSRVRTIEAISGIINIVIMPMWIVSGVFFSAQRFPDFIQPIIRVLPLTLLIDALRAVELRGAPLGDQWFHMAAMGAWLAATFLAGLALFRWR
jgi:ABC-type multidrug transport system permease subunit